MSARYAIYLAPAPQSDLWRRVCAWLGRDAAADEDVPFAGPPGIDPARAAAMTADARRYGFHATVKAPFRLATGKTVDELCIAVEDFARGRNGFAVPLRVSAIGSFLALAELHRSEAIAALHAAALAAFEPFRAPLSEAERARRLASKLNGRQRDALARWGYPYVLEEFRLHFTLTGSLAEAERAQVEAALANHFAQDLVAPVPVDALCVFEQPTTDAPFRILVRAPFADGCQR